MDPEENKNTKVTLDLLHNLEYGDIQTGGDGFKPEDVLLPEDMGDNSDDEDSVFNYLFPQGLKKGKGKDKGVLSKNKYNEKVYNLKKKKKAEGGGKK